MSDQANEEAVVAAARAGDRGAFSALSEPHRAQLRAHCYRMLGSFDDAEDMVQETMLRAWRGLPGFEGRSRFRTWLYQIATNACLNALERTPRRVLPQDVAPPVTAATPASEARAAPTLAPEVAWLQPYPDSLLDVPALPGHEPDSLLASRENIGLAYITALQRLPPRQRAVLILAEVVGWSAAEIAALLELTVAAVNSALQRAHATVRARASDTRGDRAPDVALTDEERAALKTFMEAWEHGDPTALTNLLREDARWAMPPAPLWFDGRAAIENLLALFPPHWQGRRFKMVALGANRQPAAAAYLRPAGASAYHLSGLHVLRLEGGQIAEITTFSKELCSGFQLLSSL